MTSLESGKKLQMVWISDSWCSWSNFTATGYGHQSSKSVKEAAEMDDNYELARKAGGGGARKPLEEPNPAVPSKSGPPAQLQAEEWKFNEVRPTQR